MARNLLKDLAKMEIPPPPKDLNREVHQRLNSWLLVQQLADLAVKGMAYALGHFLRTLALGLFFSLTGHDPLPPQKTKPNEP